MTVGCELDVRGLQIAVDDAALVSGFERVGHLPGDRKRFVARQRSPTKASGERLAVHELHDEKRCTADLGDVVDRGDAGMIECGERFGFALKARKTVRVGGEGLRKDLDRHIALQPRVSRAKHPSHATFADEGGDFVCAEAIAGRDGHAGRRRSYCLPMIRLTQSSAAALLCAAGLSAQATRPPSPPPEPLALINANVVNVSDSRVTANATIVLRNGRIVETITTLQDPLLVISNGRIGLDRLNFAR